MQVLYECFLVVILFGISKGGPSMLLNALKECISILAPSFMVGSLMSLMNNLDTHPPSASALQKKELCLDVGLVLARRELNSKRQDRDTIRFMWCDATPLVGYDWLWAQTHEISIADVLKTSQAANTLTAMINRFCNDTAR